VQNPKIGPKKPSINQTIEIMFKYKNRPVLDVLGGRSTNTLSETEFDKITANMHLNYSGIIGVSFVYENYHIIQN
jgi:hypothetical protein